VIHNPALHNFLEGVTAVVVELYRATARAQRELKDASDREILLRGRFGLRMVVEDKQGFWGIPGISCYFAQLIAPRQSEATIAVSHAIGLSARMTSIFL